MRDLPQIVQVSKGEYNDINCIYLALNCINQSPGTAHIGMFIKCI
jgi:hypothetical protein